MARNQRIGFARIPLFPFPGIWGISPRTISTRSLDERRILPWACRLTRVFPRTKPSWGSQSGFSQWLHGLTQDYLSWVFPSSAHISIGKYVRTITFDRWLWPKASLDAAVFRVSFYPLDGLFLPMPTQTVCQSTSTLEVHTSVLQNLSQNRVFLSKSPSSLVIGEREAVTFWVTFGLPLTSEVWFSAKVFFLRQGYQPGLERMGTLVFRSLWSIVLGLITGFPVLILFYTLFRFLLQRIGSVF
jgi:hypothetical protein